MRGDKAAAENKISNLLVNALNHVTYSKMMVIKSSVAQKKGERERDVVVCRRFYRCNSCNEWHFMGMSIEFLAKPQKCELDCRQFAQT